MACPDGGVDLSTPLDMSSTDLATPEDLAVPSDLENPNLSTGEPGLSTAPDLSPAQSPDLATPLTLTGAGGCSIDGGGGGESGGALALLLVLLAISRRRRATR
jgi:MYXO-CTERM domain-containing protein